MKILIISNHSYMLYKFRRELIDRLSKENEVVLCMPFVGHENDFRQMGIRCVELDINRRGISPAADLRLIQFFHRQMVSEKPDLVITYSIKPNIYAGLVCSALKIPYCANIQGLGTAFEYSALAGLVKCLYRISLRKAKVVFFENEGDAETFFTYRILPRKKMKVLPGAGVNLESFPLVPYPENEKFSFLYLGRIMREKGVEELFAACHRYFQKTGRRISFEYAMIDGVNDSDAQADLIAKKIRGMPGHVNLIPLNEVAESPFKPSRRTAAFQKRLESHGITATVRRSLGGDIDASCGQLRRKAMEEEKR